MKTLTVNKVATKLNKNIGDRIMYESTKFPKSGT